MGNIEKEYSNQNSEMSIWELLSLLFKNKILFIVILIITISVGVVYSFVFQTQGEKSYYFKELVVYDDWSYYMPGFDSTYARDLRTNITQEFGKPCVNTVLLKDEKANDNKDEYTLTVYFLPNINKEQAENLSQKIIDWHNSIMDAEMKRLIENKEQEVNELFEKYISSELEYHNFLNESKESAGEVMSEEIVLSSQKNMNYELWRTESLELQDLKYDNTNINAYYLSNFVLYKKVLSTWKSNIFISIILGIFISIVIIFFKESYKNYKANKIYS